METQWMFYSGIFGNRPSITLSRILKGVSKISSFESEQGSIEAEVSSLEDSPGKGIELTPD
jgi:hypothetical protein